MGCEVPGLGSRRRFDRVTESLLRALGEVFGTVVTRNEVAWLEALREASERTDPTLTNRARSAIFGIFGK